MAFLDYRITHEDDEWQLWELKETTLIGRSPECDLVLRDATVSRKHCVISQRAERFYIEDLGSTSGTFVNAERVKRNVLHDADEITLGAFPLEFRDAREPPSVGTQGLHRRMVALDPQAYHEFADRFGPIFYRLFRSKWLKDFEAQDLAVTSVTEIGRKVAAERYDPAKGRFEAWVFKVALNILKSWLRKNKLRRGTEAPLLADLPDEEFEPNMELIFAVDHALVQLEEIDRKIIELRDLGVEHTYDEIAELLGMRSGTVRVRRFRALRKLKSILEKDRAIQRLMYGGSSDVPGEGV